MAADSTSPQSEPTEEPLCVILSNMDEVLKILEQLEPYTKSNPLSREGLYHSQYPNKLKGLDNIRNRTAILKKLKEDGFVDIIHDTARKTDDTPNGEPLYYVTKVSGFAIG